MVIELHDVCPYYQKELLSILDMLYCCEVNKFSLLLIPNFKGTNRLDKYLDFVEFINRLDQEIIMHGCYHIGKKDIKYLLLTYGEGEFIGLDRFETFRRLDNGKEILNKVQIDVKYFVPPAWISNKFLEEELQRLNFSGVGYRWYLKDFNRFKIYSPVLTFSNRSVLSFLSKVTSSIFLKLFDIFSVIRLAIHMKDARDDEKITLWKKIIKMSNHRRMISYGELFSKG